MAAPSPLNYVVGLFSALVDSIRFTVNGQAVNREVIVLGDDTDASSTPAVARINTSSHALYADITAGGAQTPTVQLSSSQVTSLTPLSTVSLSAATISAIQSQPSSTVSLSSSTITSLTPPTTVSLSAATISAIQSQPSSTVALAPSTITALTPPTSVGLAAGATVALSSSTISSLTPLSTVSLSSNTLTALAPLSTVGLNSATITALSTISLSSSTISALLAPTTVSLSAATVTAITPPSTVNLSGSTITSQVGTDASGITPPVGATGMRGWLSALYLYVTTTVFPVVQPGWKTMILTNKAAGSTVQIKSGAGLIGGVRNIDSGNQTGFSLYDSASTSGGTLLMTEPNGSAGYSLGVGQIIQYLDQGIAFTNGCYVALPGATVGNGILIFYR